MTESKKKQEDDSRECDWLSLRGGKKQYMRTEQQHATPRNKCRKSKSSMPKKNKKYTDAQMCAFVPNFLPVSSEFDTDIEDFDKSGVGSGPELGRASEGEAARDARDAL